MTFVPLSAKSPDAEAIQETYLASVRARLEANEYPPALGKQYKLQLGHIKAQAPYHEIVLVQSIGFSTRKPDNFDHPDLLTHIHSCPGPQEKICNHHGYDESAFFSRHHCAGLGRSSWEVNAYHHLQHIKSSNPLVHPVIDPHYFEQEYGKSPRWV